MHLPRVSGEAEQCVFLFVLRVFQHLHTFVFIVQMRLGVHPATVETGNDLTTIIADVAVLAVYVTPLSLSQPLGELAAGRWPAEYICIKQRGEACVNNRVNYYYIWNRSEYLK